MPRPSTPTIRWLWHRAGWTQGAAWLHVVDLDGAVEGEPRNLSAIEQIVKSVPVPVQVGGGIRSVERIERYLGLGVARVIIGTLAIEQPLAHC